MKWIHEQDEWPNFYWNLKDSDFALLSKARLKQGILIGKLDNLGLKLKSQAELEGLSAEIVASSNIEGEKLSRDDVRSSLAKRFGLTFDTKYNNKIDNLVEIYCDALDPYKVLNKDRLCAWQAALFPNSRSGIREITTGDWRKESMAVVSGPFGKEKVHYVAPEASRISFEMERFFQWIYAKDKYGSLEPVLKSGLAHLWFVLIHPFSDGNGRIARTLSDALLAQCEYTSIHFYSLSNEYDKNKDEYYNLLDLYDRDKFDITKWMQYQIRIFSKSMDTADKVIADVVKKNDIWAIAKANNLNSRQCKVLNKLLNNFEGNFTQKKYEKIAKCSFETAKKEILEMVSCGILEKIKNSKNFIVRYKNAEYNDMLEKLSEDPLLIRDISYDMQTEDIVRKALNACQITVGINPSDLEEYIREDLRKIVCDYQGFWEVNQHSKNLVWHE